MFLGGGLLPLMTLKGMGEENSDHRASKCIVEVRLSRTCTQTFHPPASCA